MTAWDISWATATGATVSTQDVSSRGLAVKPDGTVLWEVGGNGSSIEEYSLSTGWDLSTASYTGTSLSTDDGAPASIAWKPDGTSLFEVGLNNDDIIEYAVSTAWDITTASTTGASVYVGGQDSSPTGMAFKPDGSRLWVIGRFSDAVYEYTLSPAWDLSTASSTGASFDVTGPGAFDPSGVTVRPDGSMFWVVAEGDSAIYEGTVSTAWDLSTASFTGTSLTTQDADPTGMAWKEDGSRFFEIGRGSDQITEWSVPIPPSVDTLAASNVRVV